MMELKEFRETGGQKTSEKKKLRNRVGGTNRLPGQRNEGGVTYSGGVIRHSGRTEHLRAEDDQEETGRSGSKLLWSETSEIQI